MSCILVYNTFVSSPYNAMLSGLLFSLLVVIALGWWAVRP